MQFAIAPLRSVLAIGKGQGKSLSRFEVLLSAQKEMAGAAAAIESRIGMISRSPMLLMLSAPT
jgi:hypothetical protein